MVGLCSVWIDEDVEQMYELDTAAMSWMFYFFIFFFQAEDGIRDSDM